MNNPTYYVNAYAAFIRATEFSTPDWQSGCNISASNSPGIGIATDVTLLGESPQSWTLLDQSGAAREPQKGQIIGTVASILLPGIVVADNAESTGSGQYTGDGLVGSAHLESLDDGWIADPF